MELLLQPILAVHEAGDDVGHHIVAGSVDHGGGRIDEVADHDEDGEGDLHLSGEKDGADDILADVAAAGHAGHTHGGQHCHQQDGDQLTPGEGLTEHAEHKGDLQHAAEAGAVHVHGCAQRNDHLADVLADARLLSHFHIGGDGGNGGAGTQRDDSGAGNVTEHGLHSTLAAAEPGKQGEGGEDVDEAQGIVHHHGAAVALHHLRAVAGNKIGEDGEESDGRIVGDDLHELQHDLAEGGEPLGNGALGTLSSVGGKAEQQREDDERQHGLTAQQTHEVAGGEEVDDQIRDGGILAHLLGVELRPGLQHGREDLHQHEHNESGDEARHHEGGDGTAQNLTCALAALHAGHGAGDGGKDQRHHHAEHHVDKHGTKGLDLGAHLGEEPADDTAQNHRAQHDRQETIVLQNRFLFHESFLLLNRLLL